MTDNLSKLKYDTWIYQAQINEMRTFLGGELYKLMSDNWDGAAFPEARFNTLWLGDDSGEELFLGLWRAIAAFSVSTIIKNNAFNVTRFSNSNLSSEIEDHAEQTAAFSKASETKSQGIKILNEVDAFLRDSDLYPEWEIPASSEAPSTFEYIRVHNKNTYHGF